MVTTAVLTQEDNLSLYLQICADAYDTFIYNLGDGHDVIGNLHGYDTIVFGEGITSSMLQMIREDNGNLLILFDGQEGSICIQEYFNHDDWKIERIVLSDNTEITDFEPFMNYARVTENYTVVEGAHVKDVIVEGENDVTVIGDSRDNNIEGNSGNNTYQGNEGNDYIRDEQGGNDVYIYNAWNGWDTITDQDGYDTVRFGEGLTVENMQVMSRNGDGLEIWFHGNDGNLVIEGCLSDISRRIERFNTI